MAIRLKPGVSIQGVAPEMAIAVSVIAAILDGIGIDCVITSGVDGNHMPNSLHYSGYALDFRLRDVPTHQHIELQKSIKSAMGRDFDVVLESDHIHVEFDPKNNNV